MAVYDFSITEGTTQRMLFTAQTANGTAFDFTGCTIRLVVKAKSSDVTPALDYSLAVSGAGVGTPTPSGSMFLGRPNPANYSGALIDTAATTGYVTARFAPADTDALVTSLTKVFVYECRVTTGGADVYTLGTGTITVIDSIIDA